MKSPQRWGIRILGVVLIIQGYSIALQGLGWILMIASFSW